MGAGAVLGAGAGVDSFVDVYGDSNSDEKSGSRTGAAVASSLGELLGIIGLVTLVVVALGALVVAVIKRRWQHPREANETNISKQQHRGRRPGPRLQHKQQFCRDFSSSTRNSYNAGSIGSNPPPLRKSLVKSDSLSDSFATQHQPN